MADGVLHMTLDRVAAFVGRLLAIRIGELSFSCLLRATQDLLRVDYTITKHLSVAQKQTFSHPTTTH
jgi:hypothetical protein